MRKNNIEQIIEQALNIIRDNFSIEVAHKQVLGMYNSILQN